MKLVIVASEFPPTPGGMQQHALGVSEELSKFYEVIVLTTFQHREHKYKAGFEVKPVLHKKRHPDFDEIAALNADAVLTLNAGYAPVSNYTSRPVFCYCHGNDFLNPWINSTPEPFKHFVDKIDKKSRKTLKLEPYRRYLQPAVCRYNIANGLKRAKSIFVNSYYTQQVISRKFKNCRAPIYVAHPGVPDYMFDIDDNYSPNLNKNGLLRLLTAARLARNAKKKNVDNVLRALAKIKDDITFEYNILGDGDMRLELEGLAAQLGISEQTHFLGTRPNREIPSWLDESDLFVLPSKASKYDVESFGIVYVEAAARGVPSLASRAGGAVDAIADGISGIILEGSEPDDIAGGIRRFVAEREKFHAPKIIEFAENFRWERVAKVMHEKIEKHIDS